MTDIPKEDVNDEINNTSGDNDITDAKVKTPNNPSETESLDEPYRPRLKRIILSLKNRRTMQVLAGIGILILIIIGAIIFYKVSNHFWLAKQRRIAEKKCKEYTKFACDHPLSSNSSQILLGEIAPLGMYPHMAFLQFVDSINTTGRFSCGGSLISENFILSAAHCASGIRNVEVKAKLGVVDRFTGEPYAVKKVYIHPLFSSEGPPSPPDFLLLELDRKVEFTPYLRPICLNTEYLGKYDRIIATGWGVTEDGFLSDVLRHVDLVIDGVVGEQCDNLTRQELGDLATQFICAGWPNLNRGVYEGDSGGPLQVLSDSQCANTYVQIGVTSVTESGDLDANQTLIAIYAMVANAVPWIASIVWPNESA